MVTIVLTGAGFGYWMVRRFILSKDGSVDSGNNNNNNNIAFFPKQVGVG